MKIVYSIATVTAFLVLALAAAAFALSYDALKDLAQANGVTPSLTWLYPLVIDGFIIVASLSVLRNALLTEGSKLAWSLVIAFTALSTGFNVAHAEAKPLAQAVAAVPPLTLVLAFELLMGQIKASVGRYRTIAGQAELDHRAKEANTQLARLTTMTDTRRDALTQLTQQAKAARAELADVTQRSESMTRMGQADGGGAAGGKVAARRESVAVLLADGMTQARIADTLDVGESTIKRDVRAMRAAGVISENGRERDR